MPIRVLTPRYTALYLFCCSTIFPIVRRSELKRDRARLLWAIGTGRTIDLPLYMYRVFCEDYLHPRAQGAIPFGCILTRLIEEVLPASILGILREQQPKGAIDCSTVRRSTAHLPPPPPQEQPQPPPQEQPQPAQPAKEQIPAPVVQTIIHTLQQMQEMLTQQGQALEILTALVTQQGQTLTQITETQSQQSTVIGRLEATLTARGEELAAARAVHATQITALEERIRGQTSTLDHLVGEIQQLRPPPSAASSSDEDIL